MSLARPARRAGLVQLTQSRKLQCCLAKQRHASGSTQTPQNGNNAKGTKPSKTPSADNAAQPGTTHRGRLLGPVFSDGVSIVELENAQARMQLRKMPYDKAEHNWVLEAKHRSRAAASERAKLAAEKRELAERYKTLLPDLKKGKRKDSPGNETVTEGESGRTIDAEMDELRARSKIVKDSISAYTDAEDEMRNKTTALRLTWPNACHPDVPTGSEENAILVSVKDPLGTLPSNFESVKDLNSLSRMQVKDFPAGPGADPARDHLNLLGSVDQAEVDMTTGVLATGSSWPYLLGNLSLLEHALTQYALSAAVQRGFMPVSPPDVVRTELAVRCGFRPRDLDANQTYKLESHKADAPELCLAATAEIPLSALLASRQYSLSHKRGSATSNNAAQSLIERTQLPIKMVAMGHAFRAEAGARGADTRGLYRVHQFTKVEMYVATRPDGGASDKMLEELRELQEDIIGRLGLAYRVLDMPTEELGASAYRKYDIEVWMPGRGSWGEVSSASNCTDYQAKRLNIKTIGGGSDAQSTLHTLNATAAAIPRLIVAVLETHGTQDGKLVLPDTLTPFWLGGPEDPNVVWLSTGSKDTAPKVSRLQAAIKQVRAIAIRNGTNPSTMVASVVILHELTAIIPLFALFFLFSALGLGTDMAKWLLGDEERPSDYHVVRRFRLWAQRKEERFEKYCRRKGYLGFDKDDTRPHELGQSINIAGSFANMVAAFILVKALLPVRIAMSIGLAAPFSRAVLEPLKRTAKSIFRPSAKA